MTRVGFVGLGDQGAPMARRVLDAGYDLIVHARRPAQAERLIADGAAWASSLAALAHEADVFGVCVPDDADVKEVFDSAFAYLKPGSIAVIHSTVHPETCRTIGENALKRGISVLDAPVSGGRKRAAEGRLTVMVGGDRSAFEAALPILETFGSPVQHVGPLGSGQAVKLINNYLYAAQLDVAAQAVELIGALGLEILPAMRVIASSTGSTACIQRFVDGGAKRIFPRHSDGRSRGASLLAKDVALARSILSDSVGIPHRLDENVTAGLNMAVLSGEIDNAQDSSGRSNHLP